MQSVASLLDTIRNTSEPATRAQRSCVTRAETWRKSRSPPNLPPAPYMPTGDEPAVRLASSLRLQRTGIVGLSDFGDQLFKSCILLQTSEAYVLFHTLRRFLRQSV